MHCKEIFFHHREIVKILSEKCGMGEKEVRESYEEFLIKYPEGEISKEEYIGSMKVGIGCKQETDTIKKLLISKHFRTVS